MPHIAVKMYPGRSEADKERIAQALTEALKASAGSSDDAISITIEDVAPQDWAEAVYRPEIEAKADCLYKKPGYSPP